MSLEGMLFESIVGLILLIWMIFRIWQRSILLAIVSFFFWPALIVALFVCWGDESADIKVPFFLFAALTAWTVYASKPARDLRSLADPHPVAIKVGAT